MTLNTYGMKTPTPTWKLFEVEGFQVLASVVCDEDDDKFKLFLEGDAPGLGQVTIKLGGSNGSEELAQKMFDALGVGESTPEKVIQGWLDQVGPVVGSLSGGDGLPEGYEVDKVVYDNGAVVSGDGVVDIGGVRLDAINARMLGDEDEDD